MDLWKSSLWCYHITYYEQNAAWFQWIVLLNLSWMTYQSWRIYFHSTLNCLTSKDQGKRDFHDMSLLINGEFCFPSINDEGLLERLLCFYEWHFILIGSLFRAIASSNSLDCCSCGSCCVRMDEVVNTHTLFARWTH